MPRIKLDDRIVNSLVVEKETDFTDVKTPGEFGVRVYPPTKRHLKGRKAWFIRYRVMNRQDEKRRRHPLGDFPTVKYQDAKAAAAKVAWQVFEGFDPQAQREERKDAITFAELASEYLEFHSKPNKRSWKEDERILNTDLLPAWASLPIEDITRGHVRDLLLEIAQGRGARIMANRTQALVSNMFTYAIEAQMIQTNPIYRMRRLGRERTRERVLSPNEIRTLWQVWTEEDSVVSAVFRTLLLTGQRSGEVMRMSWDQIESDGWWDLPQEMTKARRGHRVFLTDMTLGIIAGTRDYRWVFPSPRYNGRDHIACLKTAVRRYRKVSGLQDWSPHDLRRTFSSWMYSEDVSEHIIMAIMNHAPIGVTRRHYNKYRYAKDKRAAMILWSNRIRDIISGETTSEEARVLQFKP